MPPPDEELKWCAVCYMRTWHYDGVCQWQDAHPPAPLDDDDYERDAEDAQRRRDAAEGFDDA